LIVAPDTQRRSAVKKLIHVDRSSIILAIIIAIAALVRFWALDFGLPHTLCRPDEARIVNLAVRFGGGDLNPHFFSYPTLYPYVLFILYGLYYVVGMILGMFSSLSDFVLQFATDPSRFYLINRMVVATLGTATVYVVYRAAALLFTRRVALVSAFFLSLAYLHARDSHFGVTDIPMTFLIMTSFFFIVGCSYTPSTKNYALAGLFAGLAASTKYAGAMLLVPMVIVHLFDVTTERKPFRSLPDKRIIVFGMTLIGAFIMGMPFAVLDFPRFLSDFSAEMKHLPAGHRQIILGRGWWYHLCFSLFYGLGWPLLIASLVGMVLTTRHSVRRALILLSFPLVYYFMAGKGYTVFVRYVIPLAPFLCVAAAVGIVQVVDLMSSRLLSRVRTVLIGLLAVFIIVPSARRIIAFDSLLARRDNRLVATEWVYAKIPKGSSIYQSCTEAGRLQLNPGQFFIEKYRKYETEITAGLKDDNLSTLLTETISHLKANALYQEWPFVIKEGTFNVYNQPEKALPDYIIAERSPLHGYNAIPLEVSDLLISSYQLVQAFYAIDVDAEGNVFDQQDLFYVPYAGFNKVERPGPNIYIYVKKTDGT
jgi:hypothetical protein